MSQNFLSLDFEDNPVLRFQALKFDKIHSPAVRALLLIKLLQNNFTEAAFLSHLQSSVFIIAIFTVITL